MWCKRLQSGVEVAKKLWGGDKPYCLGFDDVTMFTQPQYDVFVKLAKWGHISLRAYAHRGGIQ